MITDQLFEGRASSLKYAAKISARYEKQLAAYDKRRGKRNQTVVVKHVTVKEGAGDPWRRARGTVQGC